MTVKAVLCPGTRALAPHIVLEWTGVPYEAERVDPSSNAYRPINRLGRGSAQQDGGPKVMTQSDAIQQLDDAITNHAGY